MPNADRSKLRIFLHGSRPSQFSSWSCVPLFSRVDWTWRSVSSSLFKRPVNILVWLGLNTIWPLEGMLLPQALMIGPKWIWICIIFICIRQHLPHCYPGHPLFLGCLSLSQAAWTPDDVHLSAIPGIPRLTAPFPAKLDIVPPPPPLGGERDSTDARGSLRIVPVHSVYNVIVPPSWQQGLPQLAQFFCSVPVSVPVSMTVSLPVSVSSSVPVSPALQLSLLPRYLRFPRSHHYSWTNSMWSCTIIPTNQL